MRPPAQWPRRHPFGTPEEVAQEVKSRIEVFGKEGGFVFNTIHNIQANTPVENILAMLRALGECAPDSQSA